MTAITSKTARAKLAPRRAPYWTQLGRGAYMGFRRSATGAGTWHVRFRDGNGDQHYQSLGEIEEFTDAKEKAERWLSQATAGAHRAPSRGSVRDALTCYVRHLRSIGRRSTAWDAGQRFRLTVGRTSDFGRMKLQEVRREDIDTWRDGLRKGRQPRSVNRQVRSVVAALNYAVKEGGHVGNREAWTIKHLVDDGEEATPVFLTALQRDRLIAAASPTLAAFLTACSHTGGRPGELAKATVADFDAKGGTVTLFHKKGKGSKVRSRAVQLDDNGIKFFKAQVRGKLPKAPLTPNDEGGHWIGWRWGKGVEMAVEAANKSAKKPVQRIPDGATAYSFRHTRISELLQVYGIDPVTTAQQCGTSLQMIERCYFKFISSSMRDKLNAVRAGK